MTLVIAKVPGGEEAVAKLLEKVCFVSHNEEHLVMDAGAAHSYQIGDVLYGLPYHVCPTVALYEKAITVEAGTASGEWRTVARDRSIGC